MTRRLTSSGTRSSKQRLPASMWKTGMPMPLGDVAPTGRCPCRRGPAGDRARARVEHRRDRRRGSRPRGAAKPSPSIAEIAVRGAHAELVEEDVAERRVEVLPGVDERRARSARSSRSITRLRRMISGRVPRTVTTFIARAAVAGIMPCAEQLGDRATSTRSSAELYSRPCERLAVGLRGRAAPAAAAGSPGSRRASTVRGASSSETRISWIFSPGRMPTYSISIVAVADQRPASVHDPRRRQPRDVGLARRCRRAAPRRPCRRPGRG